MIIGVGTDIESVDRFKKLWFSRNFILSKLFFNSEIAYAETRDKPWETLAGLWCVKESVVKSITTFHRIKPTDVEVVKPSPEQFQINICLSSSHHENIIFWVSVSHSSMYATSFCVAETKN